MGVVELVGAVDVAGDARVDGLVGGEGGGEAVALDGEGGERHARPVGRGLHDGLQRVGARIGFRLGGVRT